MKYRPGGELSKRFLDLTWMIDKSASMNEAGKMSSLNVACREALPFIKMVQQENPTALIRINTLLFSHGAEWVNSEPVPIENFEWKDIVADPVPKGNNKLEIVFLIDTSGSMTNKINAVKESCVNFAATIKKQGLAVKLGLVGFDIGGYHGKQSANFSCHNLSRYTIGIWNLTEPSVFKSNIQELNVGIFGGEGCYLADRDTVDIFPHVKKVFGEGTKRILVIISDEIGKTSGLNAIVKTLKNASITTYVLGVSSGKAHKEIAGLTGGEFWDIQNCNGQADFSSLLVNNVAETIGREAKKTLTDGSVSNGTDLGAAIRLLTQRISMDKMPLRCLPPVAVLISDGQPTDDYKMALESFNREPWARKMVRLSVAIGDDCNRTVMQKFINNQEIKPLKASNAGQLIRFLKFCSTVVLKKVSNHLTGGSVIDIPKYIETASGEENIW
jgi:uncharacterized protein YegL